MKPEYPIKVVFEEFGETWILKTEEDMVTSLEWFDSESLEEPATVTDNKGRAVRLQVEDFEIVLFELA